MEDNSSNNPNPQEENGNVSNTLISLNSINMTIEDQSTKPKENVSEIETNSEEKVNNDIKEEMPKNNSSEFLNELNDYKKSNFKKLFIEKQFCDYFINSEWRIGIIYEIKDEEIIIKDPQTLQKFKYNISKPDEISYFRKYTKCSQNNFYNQSHNFEQLQNKLSSLIEKKEKIFNTEEISWNIYYFLNSEVYFGFDMAMKTGDEKSIEEFEIEFNIILTVLEIIANFFKYLKNNFQNLLYYEKNIKYDKDLCDLVVLNKNYSIFSFFPCAQKILSKIFANEKSYLYWYVENEKYLKKVIFSQYSKTINENSKLLNFPRYEEQIDSSINDIIKLTKICIDKAYKPQTTFTSLEIQIKANILAYFTDYFHEKEGFKILFNILSISECCSFELINDFIELLNLLKSLTNFYAKEYQNEKQDLKRFLYNFIDNLDKETIEQYKRNEILRLIKKVVALSTLHENISTKSDNSTEKILYENLYLNYILKNLILSTKLEQKIASINTINNILKSIEFNKIPKVGLTSDGYQKYKDRDTEISKMSYEDFCVCCKEKNIIQTLLNEKSVHEEIIKRLPEIIFIMYKYKFGYLNKSDADKIESDKELIYTALFTKLLESDQNNENISKKIQEIICKFTDILSENDKSVVYSKVKNYFDESIKNKGMPSKELFYFIINFSINAINNCNFSNSNNNIIQKNEEKDEFENEENSSNSLGIDKEEAEEITNEDKFFNFKFNENIYYGLQLLRDYLSEEKYENYNMTKQQKKEIINICIEGILKILEQCKINTFLFKNIFFEITRVINSSKNIVQHLFLFKKIIEHPKNTLSERVKKIFEDFSVNYKFFNILMSDMQRYMIHFDKNKDDNQNEKEIVYEGFYDNKTNIELRLEFIFMLLLKEKNSNNL